MEPRAAPEASKKQPFQTSPGDKSPPNAQKRPLYRSYVILAHREARRSAYWPVVLERD